MSGIVQNNILRSSGTVAVSAAGLNWSDTIITGSTATVEAGNGYWINTTSAQSLYLVQQKVAIKSFL
jgi:hypothetical protein